MEANTQTTDELLNLVQRYAERLLNLIQTLHGAKLGDPNDAKTVTIRGQIEKFKACVISYLPSSKLTEPLDSVLISATQTMEGGHSSPFLLRLLGRSTIKANLNRCRSHLTLANSQLNVG